MTLTSPPFPCLPCRINLFTNRFEGPVLDHRYYAGGCSPHYILNTRFRKPYNVESYTPQVCESQEAPAGQWREHIQGSQPAGNRGPALWLASWGRVDASLFLFEGQFFLRTMDSSLPQDRVARLAYHRRSWQELQELNWASNSSKAGREDRSRAADLESHRPGGSAGGQLSQPTCSEPPFPLLSVGGWEGSAPQGED